MGFFSSIGRAIFGESIASKVRKLAQDSPFQLKLERGNIELDDGSTFDALKFMVKGVVYSGDSSLKDDYMSICSCLFADGPSIEGKHPILCSIGDLQRDDSIVFSHATELLNVKYGAAGGWDEWVPIMAVPVDSLTFPAQGLLTVYLEIRIIHCLSTWSSEKIVNISYLNHQKGYLESSRERRRGTNIAVSLAVLISAVDGVRDEEEGKTVNNFIRKQLSAIEDEDSKEQRKQELNNSVKKVQNIFGYDLIRENAFKLAKEAADFDSTIKFQILELLLDVAGADNVAAKHETDFLNDLAIRLGVDVDEYKNMRDKALPISIYEETESSKQSQIEGMLGLKKDMTVTEKKSLLSREYRKWNSLKNSSDPAKSRQAKDMVSAISELRKNL